MSMREEILNRMANEGLVMIYLEQELATELLQARQRIRELEEQQSALTEQLRLANEDAERLAPYWSHLDGCQYNMSGEYDDDLCDCGCIESLRLHEERIAQER